jgi:hypothetical protein
MDSPQHTWQTSKGGAVLFYPVHSLPPRDWMQKKMISEDSPVNGTSAPFFRLMSDS